MSDRTKEPIKIGEQGTIVEHLEYKKLMHDLRNGLSPILMQAQLLSQYMETPGTDAAAIKNAADALGRSVKAMALLLDRR